MAKPPQVDLMFHLSYLEDPRTGENTQHKFIDILFISVCAIICGCECWTEFEDYARRLRL